MGVGSQAHKGVTVARGAKHHPQGHTEERNGSGALLFPAQDSSLSLGGLCRAAGPELCLAWCPGTPKVSPYLPPSRALRPGSAPRGASWLSQRRSPALSFIAVLSAISATHLFMPASISIPTRGMWGALGNVDLASGPAGSDSDGLGRALRLTSFVRFCGGSLGSDRESLG